MTKIQAKHMSSVNLLIDYTNIFNYTKNLAFLLTEMDYVCILLRNNIYLKLKLVLIFFFF